jgi:hypothetical protein
VEYILIVFLVFAKLWYDIDVTHKVELIIARTINCEDGHRSILTMISSSRVETDMGGMPKGYVVCMSLVPVS